MLISDAPTPDMYKCRSRRIWQRSNSVSSHKLLPLPDGPNHPMAWSADSAFLSLHVSPRAGAVQVFCAETGQRLLMCSQSDVKLAEILPMWHPSNCGILVRHLDRGNATEDVYLLRISDDVEQGSSSRVLHPTLGVILISSPSSNSLPIGVHLSLFILRSTKMDSRDSYLQILCT